MKDIELYKEKVEQEFVQWYFSQNKIGLSEEQIDHVKSIGVSILQTRDGGMQGGGFVQAVVANDLSGAFNRADSTNLKVIPFYVILKDHVRV
jgi:hypothetical protein